MTSLSIREKTYKTLNFREEIVEFLKIYTAIKPLQFFYKKEALNITNHLKALPHGTIGSDVYKMLTNNGLKVIPKFENHDLKHLILGYGMTSIEEIKMQAYLFGNGNKTIPCILFLISGLLFPEEWNTFYKEYKKGEKSVSIHNLSFKETVIKQTNEVKFSYNKQLKKIS